MAIFAPSFSQKNSQTTQTPSKGKQALMVKFFEQMNASVDQRVTPVQAQKQQQRLA